MFYEFLDKPDQQFKIELLMHGIRGFILYFGLKIKNLLFSLANIRCILLQNVSKFIEGL